MGEAKRTALRRERAGQGIGQRLREMRGKRSQEDFAASLGVSRNTLSRYETGESPPKTKFLRLALEKYPGRTYEWLMTGVHIIKTAAPPHEHTPHVAAPAANYSAGIDEDLMRHVIETLEKECSSRRGSFGQWSAEKRAAAIAAVYERSAPLGAVHEPTVSRMVTLAQ